jgi:hypothetical protein
MRAPIALSKSKLLSLTQCRRKLWLETYCPELVPEPSAEKTALLTAGHVVGALARQLYGRGGGHVVAFERGLRAAIDSTRALVAAGGREPIFEATFDHDGVSVRIDVLERSADKPKLIEVKSSARVKDHYLDDCAIQAWALAHNGLEPRQIAIATLNPEFIYPGDGRYEGLLLESDVTARVQERLARVGELVVAARRTLAELDEPTVGVGTHCRAPYECELYGHCAPPPKAEQTEPLKPYVGDELRALASGLPFPRYYLDFETIAPAVPIFAGTRPFEMLPFQWSCHIETSLGRIEHAEFLELGAEPPMRRLAESLLEALGTSGPIVVYTPYERRVLNELAARYGDLAGRLAALTERIVDLYPATRRHYSHPALHGSWSIKAVLPTVAPDLNYQALGEVRDGLKAQAAYLEALDRQTMDARRAALRGALLAYCRHDTLALVRLVEFFAR